MLLPSRIFLLALLAGGLGSSAYADLPNWMKWVDKMIVKRVQTGGFRQLGYHSHTVTGDKDAYNTTNYYGQGGQKFTNIGSINYYGRGVLGLFNFEGTIQDSRVVDPQGQRFSLDYDKKGVTVNLGDINGSLLNTNRFASFNKSLRGVAAGFRQGNFQSKIVYSAVKGSARTISIQGTNSSGPYYIQNNQVIRGSQHVKVDNQDVFEGTDYTFDPDAGTLTFINRVIPLTSVILISYEALGFNESAGLVEGAGLSYDTKKGKIGLTAMQQVARNKQGLRSRLEKFEGFGPPSVPYVLQFEPINPASVTIRVNGIVQIEGVDYRFDSVDPSIFYFNRFMSSADRIDVTYIPKPRGTVDGDRSVVGIDYALSWKQKPKQKEKPDLYRLAENGSINLYASRGKLHNTPTPQSGTARGGQLRYQRDIYTLDMSVRDIPSGFVTIDNAGFSRNERAYDSNLTIKPSRKHEFVLHSQNSSVSTLNTDVNGNQITNRARVIYDSALARYTPNDYNRWELLHYRSKTQNTFNASRIDSSELSSTLSNGRFPLRFGLTHQTGYSKSSSVNRFALDSGKLSTSYNHKNIFSLSADASLVHVKSSGKSGTGRDYSLSANYQPSTALRISSAYQLSDAGALLALQQFSNGFGTGYDGNGFSSGSGSNSLIGATNLKRFSNSILFHPNERFSAGFNYVQYTTSGAISSNASTQQYGGVLSYMFHNNISVSLNADKSKTSYLSSTARSGVTSYGFAIDGQPKGRLSFGLGGSIFNTTGNSTFRQDSNQFYGELSYRLRNRQNVIMQSRFGRSTGYLPQDSSEIGLTYQYQLWNTLALNLSYWSRRTRSLDPLVQSGGYRSSGFDLTLDFTFGR